MPLRVKERIIQTQIKVQRYRSKPFYQCTKDGEILTRWQSMGELERLTPFKRKAVTKVLHGEFKTHKKFIWKYA